jgi:hypothetical protein
MNIRNGDYMVPGYKNITAKRIQSAICHVMCDFCNFDCNNCLAKKKELLLKFITENIKINPRRNKELP